MSSYHAEIKRGLKGSARNHARYIARQGKYEDRKDLVHTSHGNMPRWAMNDPDLFWASADVHERKNGAAYREFVISIPNEFSCDKQIECTERMITQLVGDRPYQYAIHSPSAALVDALNPHIHLMYSDRAPDGIERAPDQTFARYNPTNPERGGCKKVGCGRTRWQLHQDLTEKRKAIADVQNEMLAEGGFASRVDHRSHRARGIDKAPERHLGPARINRMTPEAKSAYVSHRHPAAAF